MNLKIFFRKAWREVRKKKIHSVPLILIVLFGGVISSVYIVMYIGWQEIEDKQWDDLNHHHVLFTIKSKDIDELNNHLANIRRETGFSFQTEVRYFSEVQLQANNPGAPNIKARLYIVNTSGPMRVNQLYYYSGGETLYETDTNNAIVINDDIVKQYKWNLGQEFNISFSFDTTVKTALISRIDSSEYLLRPEIIGEFYNVWDGPVVFARRTDFNNITQNRVNQVAVRLEDTDDENQFIDMFLGEVGSDSVLQIEGRNIYLESFGPVSTVMLVISNIGFALLTAVMLFIVIRRRIKEEESTYGLLKALGFNNRELTVSSIFYGLLIALIGGVLSYIMGFGVSIVFSSFYYGQIVKILPQVSLGYDPSLMIPRIIYIILIMITATLASYLACRKIFKTPIVETLRPEMSLEPGKQTLIEKLVTKLNFSLKPLSRYSLRSLFQRKAKASFIILGVVFATFLALFGSSIVYSYTANINTIFEENQDWDLQVTFTTYFNETEVTALKDQYALESRSDAIEGIITTSLRFAQDRSQIYPVVGLPAQTQMWNFESQITPQNGEVFVSKDLAITFNIHLGDQITFYDNENQPITLMCSDILTEVTYSSIFTNLVTAREIAGIEDTKAVNALYLKTDSYEAIQAELESDVRISSISSKQETKETILGIRSIIESIFYAIVLGGLIISLAISVTVISISISERQYDFMNFRALGVSNFELFKIIIFELGLTSLFGLFFGVLLGIWTLDLLFDWAATFGFIFTPIFNEFVIGVTISIVIIEVVLSSYLSLRSLFKKTIAETTVSRMIG